MNERLQMGDSMKATVERTRSGLDVIRFQTKWTTEQFRGGRLIHRDVGKNLITREGKEDILSMTFAGMTQVSPWYVALVDNDNGSKNSGNPVAPDDTQVYDSFFDPAGGDTTNTEYIDYVEVNNYRIVYNETVTGGASPIVSNSSNKAVFTFETSSGTIYGAVLVTGQAQGDHASGGTLFSYRAFTAPITVQINDVVNVQIDISW